MKPILWTSLFWIFVLIALLVGNRSADRALWANTKSDGIIPLGMYMEDIAAETDEARRLDMTRQMVERIRQARDQRDFAQGVYDVANPHFMKKQEVNKTAPPDRESAPLLPVR